MPDQRRPRHHAFHPHVSRQLSLVSLLFHRTHFLHSRTHDSVTSVGGTQHIPEVAVSRFFPGGGFSDYVGSFLLLDLTGFLNKPSPVRSSILSKRCRVVVPRQAPSCDVRWLVQQVRRTSFASSPETLNLKPEPDFSRDPRSGRVSFSNLSSKPYRLRTHLDYLGIPRRIRTRRLFPHFS